MPAVDGETAESYARDIMSLPQILAELPVLTRQERHELGMRLLEIDSTEAERDDMAVCENLAALGFAVLDALEAKDTKR